MTLQANHQQRLSGNSFYHIIKLYNNHFQSIELMKHLKINSLGVFLFYNTTELFQSPYFLLVNIFLLRI